MQQREVAGIRCGEVLAKLGDYLADELNGEARAQIDAHLAGCEVCERFGGAYAGIVGAIKDTLRVDGEVPLDVAGRLEARLGGTQEQDPEDLEDPLPSSKGS